MPASLARITPRYALNSGSETAVNAFFMLSPTGEDLASAKAIIDSTWNAWWTNCASNYKSTLSLVGIRVDIIDAATGHVLEGTDVTTGTVPGNLSTNQLPLQCSSVLTLRTAFSGGRYRGRLYLPPMTVSALTADGFLVAASQDDILDAWHDWFVAINAGADDWFIGVYSRAQQTVSPVTSVEVGSVIDTQRGRRANLVESRATQAL